MLSIGLMGSLRPFCFLMNGYTNKNLTYATQTVTHLSGTFVTDTKKV